jgi:hypothetical protein
MKYYPICYSAKVWLGSILIGPIISAIAEYCISRSFEGAGVLLILLYPPMMLLVTIISFFAWLIFWVLIVIIIRIVPERFPQKCWITLAGIVLTAGLFYLVSDCNPAVLLKDFLTPLIGYTGGITAGVWYFHLTKPFICVNYNSFN